jgi:hypothetical protein
MPMRHPRLPWYHARAVARSAPCAGIRIGGSASPRAMLIQSGESSVSQVMSKVRLLSEEATIRLGPKAEAGPHSCNVFVVSSGIFGSRPIRIFTSSPLCLPQKKVAIL